MRVIGLSAGSIVRPRGRSKLPMVELKKRAVTTARTRVRFRSDSAAAAKHDSSFGDYVDHLDFSAWQFFHAAKKTELASSFTATAARSRALGFAFQEADTFIWNTENFRKVDSGIFELEDFASTALAGRVGEATAYLTMMKWGYVYWDRLASVWSRAARKAKITHAKQVRATKILAAAGIKRPATEPDFVFEKADQTVALVEAKGSFVNPLLDNPTVKGDLRKALKQLSGWSKLITPKPMENYGIGTYLREESDTDHDDSLITFVDPPGEEDSDFEPIGLPSEMIRRANYGAWLIGMGLGSSGHALRQMQEKPLEEIALSVANIGGLDIAFAPLGFSFPEHWGHFPDHPLWWRHFDLPHRIIGIGLAVDVLRRIERAIRLPNEPVLSDVRSGEPSSIRGEDYWSLMADGSFLGRIADDGKWRVEHFKL